MSAPAPTPDAAETPAGRRVLTFVGSVVAPTSLITALLFFFGTLHAYWFFAYFGVNYTVLGLSAQDFLFRSADGLFVPFTAVAAVVLAVLWVVRLIRVRPTSTAWRLLTRWWATGVGVLGGGLLTVTAVGFVAPDVLASAPGLPGLCLALAVLSLSVASGARLRRVQPGRRVAPGVALAEWAAGFVLVGVGLFWSAGDYSAAVGVGRGQGMELSLPSTPDVVLFSEKSLAVGVAGVTETVCTRPDAAFGVRYDGLKLIMQAGDRYVLVPAGWTRAHGVALVLPRTDSVRLEFSAPGTRRDRSC